MKDNFDIRKFLTENELTRTSVNSRLIKEGRESVCGTCGNHGYDDDLDKSCSKCGDYDWTNEYSALEEEWEDEEEIGEEEITEEVHIRSLRSLSDREFEELCQTDNVKIPNEENVQGTLVDAITALLEQELSLEDVAYILGEPQEDLDGTNYQDAAMQITDTFEDFKDAIESGWIDGDYDLSIITK